MAISPSCPEIIQLLYRLSIPELHWTSLCASSKREAEYGQIIYALPYWGDQQEWLIHWGMLHLFKIYLSKPNYAFWKFVLLVPSCMYYRLYFMKWWVTNVFLPFEITPSLCYSIVSWYTICDIKESLSTYTSRLYHRARTRQHCFNLWFSPACKLRKRGWCIGLIGSSGNESMAAVAFFHPFKNKIVFPVYKWTSL